MREPLLGKTEQELKALVEQLGEKSFRGVQLHKWLNQGAKFEEMTNLGTELRNRLRKEFDEGYPVVVERLEAQDGTRKYLFALQDGNTVESVYMPKDYGNSICISTQVGCAMGCAFCASCEGGLVRNLTMHEILGQLIVVNADNGGGITNIVLMGMGEPLDNYDPVMDFIRCVTGEDGLHMSRRSISLSTCGLPTQIRRLAEEGIGVTLCISLHAPNQAQREKLMPSAKHNNLYDILEAARYYFEKTGRRIIIEYALIGGFNDTESDAVQLVTLLKDMNCHVNLIPLNTKGKLQAPKKRAIYAFCNWLEEAGLSATVRRSMGAEIEGACGQLRKRLL